MHGILGMTATPLRTDGQNMIEKRCGKVAYELKLSDAVARGILKLPVYITSRYIFEEDIKNIEAKLEKIEDGKVRQKLEKKLRKAKKQLENAEGLKDILSKHLEKNGKYLAFCNPGDDLEGITEKAKKEGWFDEINKNQTLLIVESSKKNTENAMALRVFEKSRGKNLRILFSKNMLNEGLHDEEITGEIMMRATRSYILFVQQLGRILSKDRKDSPIVLDLVGNIHYFKEFRLEIQRIIGKAEARGDKRYDARVLEQFRIIEEQEDFIKAFEEIENSIERYLNRTSISKTIEIARILKANGVDLRNITLTKTQNGRHISILLKEIEQKKIDIEKIIKENGLDGDFKYGERINALRKTAKGYGSCKMTEEERKEAKELGLITEIRGRFAQTLEIARILKENGVDLSKTQLTEVRNGKVVKLRLKEIKQEGIDIGKIIEENGLNGEFRYGENVIQIRCAYRGKSCAKVTDEEKEELQRLGLIEKKRSWIAQALKILRILKENGVDLSKTKMTKGQRGKQVPILLGEIKQEGIDIQKIITENGLDAKYEYGKRVRELKSAYKGYATCAITEEEKEEARQLGFISEKTKSIVAQTLETSLRQAYTGVNKYRITEQEKEESRQLGLLGKIIGQDIGKASFDAPVEKCDEAQAVLDRLVEREQEGEIERNE